MVASRRSLGSLLSVPLDGLVRGLRWLIPGLGVSAELRRAEQVIADLQVELGKSIAARHLASKRLSELEVRQGELRRKIEAALDADQEGLARARVSDELRVEAEIDRCRRAVREESSLERELERALSGLLRARDELAESGSDEQTSAREAPRGDGECSANRYSHRTRWTHERRVRERLNDIQSARADREKE